MFKCLICHKEAGVNRPADMITIANHSCCSCQCCNVTYNYAYNIPITRLIRCDYAILDRMITILEANNSKDFELRIYFCSSDRRPARLLWDGTIAEKRKLGIPWDRLRDEITRTCSMETIVGSYILACSKFPKSSQKPTIPESSSYEKKWKFL